MIRVQYAGITVSSADYSGRRGDSGVVQGGSGGDNLGLAERVASLCEGVISTAERRGVQFTGRSEFLCCNDGEVFDCGSFGFGCKGGLVGECLSRRFQVCGAGCDSNFGCGRKFCPSFESCVGQMSGRGVGEFVDSKCLLLQSDLKKNSSPELNSCGSKEDAFDKVSKSNVDDVSVPVEVEGVACRENKNDGFVKNPCVENVDRPKDAVSDSFKGKPLESKTERNRRWRAESKILKKKRQAMKYDWRLGSLNSPVAKEGSSNSTSFVSEEDVALKSSLKAKWKVQNELAVEKARRELEVLKASDINQEVKRYRTKISAATERNMVSIEKTHAMLRQTGNLPNEQGGGFAETVVSGAPGLESGSGTISPDSSASMAEFRACQKALLDAERENAEYKRKIKIASEKYGFPLEQVDFLDKEVWTDTQTNQDILDEIYPNGYGKDTSLFEDGKFRAIGV